jgi:PAS domain S-box-containing protein
MQDVDAMVREEEITRITQLLAENPAGLTIEQVSRQLTINRTTAAKYLNFLIASGKIEKRNLGPAKIFTLSPRIPLSHFLNLWQDGIIILDNNLIIQQVNDPVLSLMSLKREDLVGIPVDKSPLAAMLTPSGMNHLQKAREGHEQVHIVMFMVQDQAQHFRMKMIPLVLDHGEQGLGIIFEQVPRVPEPSPESGHNGESITDKGTENVEFERRISEHRKIEKALIESEAKYRALVENITEVIFTLNDQDLITYVSPAIMNLSGNDPSALLGHQIQEYVYTDDIVPFEKGLERNRRGAFEPFEFRFLTKNRATRWVQVSGKSLPGKEAGCGFHGIIADIHERKRMEDALRHANKQIILLTSITRHDILNGITKMRLSLDLAKNETHDEKLLHFFELQESIIATIQHQINFTRDYQNIGIRPPQWKDIADRFHAAVATIPLGKILVSVDIKNIEIFADNLIERVFANLIENTLEHGVKTTTIRFFSEPQGRDLILVYEDDGVGIPGDEKKLVFEHTRRGRISYGLFFSREVLAITGLSIHETGEPGKGVRFEILVPEGLYRLRHDGDQMYQKSRVNTSSEWHENATDVQENR